MNSSFLRMPYNLIVVRSVPQQHSDLEGVRHWCEGVETYSLERLKLLPIPRWPTSSVARRFQYLAYVCLARHVKPSLGLMISHDTVKHKDTTLEHIQKHMTLTYANTWHCNMHKHKTLKHIQTHDSVTYRTVTMKHTHTHDTIPYTDRWQCKQCNTQTHGTVTQSTGTQANTSISTHTHTKNTALPGKYKYHTFSNPMYMILTSVHFNSPMGALLCAVIGIILEPLLCSVSKGNK